MRVNVQLMREGGESRTAVGSVHAVSGRLHLNRRTVGPQQVVYVLQLLEGSKRVPDLFEPKVTYIGGSEIRFLGYEKCNQAWVLQEWWCDTR